MNNIQVIDHMEHVRREPPAYSNLPVAKFHMRCTHDISVRSHDHSERAGFEMAVAVVNCEMTCSHDGDAVITFFRDGIERNAFDSLVASLSDGVLSSFERVKAILDGSPEYADIYIGRIRALEVRTHG